MNNLPQILTGTCNKCKEHGDLKYVSSTVATAGRPEQHYYACWCGSTYEIQSLITLENAHRFSVTEER